MRIDSHQHFWQYNAQEYDWISEKQLVLKAHFLPNDLKPILKSCEIDGCIAVQARQTIQETKWLIDLATRSDFIKAVVGWIDLRNDNLEADLALFEDKKVLKGFRHVLQGEPDPQFMLSTKFIRGLNVIEKLGYSYDLLVLAHQLPQTIELVGQLPNMRFVLDHIAKPSIAKNQGFANWQLGINRLAKFNNVYCKISGMVTEADLGHWSKEDFLPYMQTILEAFGPERVMFGSDWPVCLLASDYHGVFDILADFVKGNYADYHDNIFGLNAKLFYRI